MKNEFGRNTWGRKGVVERRPRRKNKFGRGGSGSHTEKAQKGYEQKEF